MNEPLVRNTSDEKQVRQAAQKVKNQRDTELSDLRSVMSTPQGRRFMWRLINGICHYDAASAQHSGSWTYFAEGERNVGRIVKSDAYEAAHDLYQEMERENWALLKGER